MAVAVPSGDRLWTSTAPLKDASRSANGTAFLVPPATATSCLNDLGELIVCKLSRRGTRSSTGRR